MSKLALLVGINQYDSDDFENLTCSEADAEAMEEALSRDWSPIRGARNYQSRRLVGGEGTRVTTEVLRDEVEKLMSARLADGEVLFYFSGQGMADEGGGFLATQDATRQNPGYPISELLDAANRSDHSSVVIILDCCHGRGEGDVTGGEGFNRLPIGPDVTLLAASGSRRQSGQDGKHSLFTRQVLDALNGGAADCRGDVSAAGIYSYVEQALGPWGLRPAYRSFASRMNPVRKCEPAVPDFVLARLPEWFPEADSTYPLDRTYVVDETGVALEPHVEIFEQFRQLRNANLLAGEDGMDLYWAAMHEKTVRLTRPGRLFWYRARRGDFEQIAG